ncbi:MAG: FtsQ-type POTRA domain-containing protein [Propionibacteriaceae bacterium]|jgi:cell division protein FtsQ|nr:FtsQ-type POTRA domain-containing protein [Propionibacteriaceae bacterium]
MRSGADFKALAAARRRAKARRRFGIAFSFTLVLALAASAFWAVWYSTALAVVNVKVVGLESLGEDAVRTAAKVQVGTPLAAVSVNDVAAQVAGLPAVAEVSVVRLWPSTVEISVRERKPRLVAKWAGSYFLADESGVAFQVVESQPKGLLLVDANPAKAQLLADAYSAYGALSAETAEKVDYIWATTVDDITLKLKSGDQVVFGSVDQKELKSQVLDVLLKQPAKSYDISAPAFPTIR